MRHVVCIYENKMWRNLPKYLGTLHQAVTIIACRSHYSDVIWAPWRLKLSATRVFVWQFVPANSKEITKALCQGIHRHVTYFSSISATGMWGGGRGLTIYKCRLTSIGIPMMKIRRSHDRLIFIMGSHTWKDGLYIEKDPWNHVIKMRWNRTKNVCIVIPYQFRPIETCIHAECVGDSFVFLYGRVPQTCAITCAHCTRARNPLVLKKNMWLNHAYLITLFT